MKFADIPGHDDIKDRLRRMADADKLPHALLLEGPAGTGKFMLARALAQYIHCTARSGGDSCGQCAACLQHSTFNHIDTLFSFPVVKGKSGGAALSDDWLDDFKAFMGQYPWMDFEQWLISLDNINARPQIFVEEGNELLRRLTYMTRRSKYKVVLLWLPERLKEETANKLLKLVEEPFADTKFIMVSNEPRLILPTIYSRVQRIAVGRYTDSEISAILASEGLASDTISAAAPLAEGSVTEAHRHCGNNDTRMRMFDLFTTLMRKAYGRKVGELRQWTDKVAELGREGMIQFIDYCTRMVRESFIMHLHDDRLQTLGADERAFAERFHPFINHLNVEDIIAGFDRARRDIAANGNAKVIFFDIALHTIIYLRRK